jgi:hypothetical protein
MMNRGIHFNPKFHLTFEMSSIKTMKTVNTVITSILKTTIIGNKIILPPTAHHTLRNYNLLVITKLLNHTIALEKYTMMIKYHSRELNSEWIKYLQRLIRYCIRI